MNLTQSNPSKPNQAAQSTGDNEPASRADKEPEKLLCTKPAQVRRKPMASCMVELMKELPDHNPSSSMSSVVNIIIFTPKTDSSAQ